MSFEINAKIESYEDWQSIQQRSLSISTSIRKNMFEHQLVLNGVIPVLDFIINESARYAPEKRIVQDFHSDRSEIICFSGILLYSGYVRFSHKNHYWSTSDDFRFAMASEYVSRDRFRLRVFISPIKMIFNKWTLKAIPLYDLLNKKFSQKQLAIDASNPVYR